MYFLQKVDEQKNKTAFSETLKFMLSSLFAFKHVHEYKKARHKYFLITFKLTTKF